MCDTHCLLGAYFVSRCRRCELKMLFQFAFGLLVGTIIHSLGVAVHAFNAIVYYNAFIGGE